jgi:hypothetical protein
VCGGETGGTARAFSSLENAHHNFEDADNEWPAEEQFDRGLGFISSLRLLGIFHQLERN